MISPFNHRFAEFKGAASVTLTPLRIKALQLIAAEPGMLAQWLADRLVPKRHGWSAQGATRWGASYVKPMWQSGLVKLDFHTTAGYAKCWITDDGIRAALALPMASADDARRTSGGCICDSCGREYRRHALGGPLGYDQEPFLNRLCNGDLVKL
jgi:hypothetical protein